MTYRLHTYASNRKTTKQNYVTVGGLQPVRVLSLLLTSRLHSRTHPIKKITAYVSLTVNKVDCVSDDGLLNNPSRTLLAEQEIYAKSRNVK